MIRITIRFDEKSLDTKEAFEKAQKEITRQIIVATMASAYRKYEKDDAFCVNSLLIDDCLEKGIIDKEAENELAVLNRSMNIDNIWLL